MASGWAKEGNVQEQIDATVKEAIDRAKRARPSGDSSMTCGECGQKIPQARRMAIPGVQRCLSCQEQKESSNPPSKLPNRRASKSSQLR